MTTLRAVKTEMNQELPKKKPRGPLILLIMIPLIVLSAGVGAYVFVPGLSEKAHDMLLLKETPAQLPPPGPIFADIPEMAITLPNGGQARQLRIRISLELMQTDPQQLTPSVLSPKVYEALLVYLRTLTDTEIDNSLAIDRIRGDLYRRLTLVLGPNVVRDVLITSLVVA